MARKLTTIMAADAVGYSALLARDERGALGALNAAQGIIADSVANRSGRLFGGDGDGVVVEFQNPVQALEAARDIQRELRSRGRHPTPSLPFRIGINVGDVLIDGDNLRGEGVKVASGLESIAGPGEILLSRSVYEQVRGKTDAEMIALGPKALKNLSEPIEVFAIRAPEGSVRAPAARPVAAGRRWYYAGVALAMALGLVATMSQRDAGKNNRLSLAVMPLGVPGADDPTRRLAQGLTEDIVTDLSRLSALDIVATDSAVAMQQKTVDDAEIGRLLNVRYVLDGNVEREADRLQVTARLIDVRTGSPVWSQQWDSKVDDAFNVQTAVAEKAAAALASVSSTSDIDAGEISRLKAAPPDTLQAYDLYLLAVAENGASTKDDIERGVEHASKAIALDPEFARAYAIRARLQYNATHHGADYTRSMEAMKADAERAVALDPNGAESRAAMAWYYLTTGSVAEADAQITAALDQNPGNVTLMRMAAAIYSTSGRPDQAAAYADKVLQLDPLASAATLNTIKDAYFFSQRYADAVSVISRVPESARSRGSRVLLTFSLAMLGRNAEYEQARAALLAAHPNVSAELLLNEGWVFARDEDLKLFLRGFEMSGLPRCASEEALSGHDNPRRLPGCGG